MRHQNYTPEEYLYSAVFGVGADNRAGVYSSLNPERAKQNINEVLETLTERERQVIGLRFGFGYENPSELEKIGNALNITRHRARQIQAKALRKLRQLERSSVLKRV